MQRMEQAAIPFHLCALCQQVTQIYIFSRNLYSDFWHMPEMFMLATMIEGFNNVRGNLWLGGENCHTYGSWKRLQGFPDLLSRASSSVMMD